MPSCCSFRSKSASVAAFESRKPLDQPVFLRLQRVELGLVAGAPVGLEMQVAQLHAQLQTRAGMGAIEFVSRISFALTQLRIA